MVKFPGNAPDFLDPPSEEQVIVLIDAVTLSKAERLIESCEHCNEENLEIPFDNILRRISRLRSERDGLHSGRAGEVSERPARDSRKDTDRTGIIS